MAGCITYWSRDHGNRLKQVGDTGPLSVVFGGPHTAMPSIASLKAGGQRYGQRNTAPSASGGMPARPALWDQEKSGKTFASDQGRAAHDGFPQRLYPSYEHGDAGGF